MFYKIEIDRMYEVFFCTIHYIDGKIEAKTFENINDVFSYIKEKKYV